LRYRDYATGKTVNLAEVANAPVQIPSGDHVVYENAFKSLDNSTVVVADLVYRIESGPARFEQDVIIRSSLPDPSKWGLQPATTLLEVVTEFSSCPSPSVRERLITVGETQSLQQAHVADHAIAFSTIAMGLGRAFARHQPVGIDSIVLKHWSSQGDSLTLVESVLFELYSKLEANALSQSSVNQGVVIDFFVVPTIPSYTFQSGQTYRVTGVVTIKMRPSKRMQ
jgi:hypothetical protein